MAFDKTDLLNDLLVRAGQLALEVADAKEAGDSWEEIEEQAYFLSQAYDVLNSNRVDTWTDDEFTIVEDRLREYGGLSKVGVYQLGETSVPFSILDDATFTETDPTVGSHIKAITSTQITNWDANASHASSTSNPHSVTKSQVGLANADNTSDLNKPVSTATQTALDAKANTSHTHTLSEVTDSGALAALNTVSATEIDSDAVTTAKIADDNVTLAKIQDVTTQVLLGRSTAGTGDVEQLSAAIARTILNVADGADAYGSWTLRVNGGNDKSVASSNIVNLIEGSNVTIGRSGDDITISVASVGVTDHGALTGLSDDDHSIYHTDARALAWLGTRSTTDLSEGTNLYYTDARFDIRLSAKSTSDLSEGTNLYYTDARFDTRLTSKSTSDLSEGTNLYYTDERVDDRVAALIQNGTGLSWIYDDVANTLAPTVSLSSFDSDNLSEGASNLYYTDERVDDRVAALIQDGTGITWSYNDVSGTLTPTVTATTDISGKLDNTTDTLTGVLTVTQDVDVQRHLLVADTINLGTTDTSSTSTGLHIDYGSSFSTFNNIDSSLYFNIGDTSGLTHTEQFRVTVDNDQLIIAGGSVGEREVSLYHANSERFKTESTGVRVIGNLNGDSLNVVNKTSEDNMQLIVTNSASTEVSVIDLVSNTGSVTYPSLKYNGVEKMKTISTGVDITGEARVNGIKVLGIQQSAIPSTTGGSTIDTEARNTQDLILAVMRAHGLIAT